MLLYDNFIGIDIGKFNFMVAIHGEKSTKEYENNNLGIRLFIADFKNKLSGSLSIIENTGGCETLLLYTLCDKGFPVHRADARKVKHFIRSFGNAAKTDALDAKALALYGFERKDRLERFKACSKLALNLYELVQRRKDLKKMLVAEKNRFQAPVTQTIKNSCQNMIKIIKVEIEGISNEINNLIENDENLKLRKTILKNIPGIGEIVAQELVVLLPELGNMNRRQIAALAGLAPRANDSGKFTGYRRTGAGRSSIKPVLFMSAMAARRSNSVLKEFYENLIKRGKKKMVALTALMRKIIVIANARLKEAMIPVS